jgi:uncharacterized protein (DUF1330 family)
MPAYVDVDVQDAAGFEEYRKRVPATIEKYGVEGASQGSVMMPGAVNTAPSTRAARSAGFFKASICPGGGARS